MTFTPTLKGEVIGNQYSLIVLVCNEDSREGRLQRLPNLKMLPQHLFPMSINSETTAPTTFISAQRKQTEAQLVTSTKEVRQGLSANGLANDDAQCEDSWSEVVADAVLTAEQEE